ncbi:3825_t:CDS:2 [Diversispora eburnea]|uniref:3825_t:CDS:1 n=1 Tax=Diversispora eburnea TaxID=1213867 RepID=A0A9N9GG76_9GLOM|nr:3825_t:CDS:2 [Diversispora eburnea]
MSLKDALAKGIAEIRGEMAANFQEISSLRQELTLARTELKRAEHDISDIRNQINLNTQMSNTNSSKFSHEISDLQSQINSIINRINNLGSSSSGSENQATQKYSNLSQTISQFTKRLNDYIKGGGSDIDKIRDIINNFIDNYLINSKQSGEALELLTNLESNSVDLIFLDPQYEKVSNVLHTNYPLYPQSDYQIMRILEQKYPTTGKKFTNRSFGTVWEESSLPTGQRKHPHQKPRELIKALIMATTNEKDLIIDPCAGSFVVLEILPIAEQKHITVWVSMSLEDR